MVKSTVEKISVGLYLILSIIALKQYFSEGIESSILNIEGIISTPFMIIYSVLAFIGWGMFKEQGFNWMTIFILIMILPVPLLSLYKFGDKAFGFFFTFLIAVIEPFKINYFSNKTEGKQRKRENIKLLFFSFLFLFISLLISSVTDSENSESKSFAYIYAFMFYGFLAYSNYNSNL